MIRLLALYPVTLAWLTVSIVVVVLVAKDVLELTAAITALVVAAVVIHVVAARSRR